MKAYILVHIHFIQCKQFNVTNVTSHTLQKISVLKIFPECFRESLKPLWRATCDSWAANCPPLL